MPSIESIIAFALGIGFAVLIAWMISLSRRVAALERRQSPGAYNNGMAIVPRRD